MTKFISVATRVLFMEATILNLILLSCLASSSSLSLSLLSSSSSSSSSFSGTATATATATAPVESSAEHGEAAAVNIISSSSSSSSIHDDDTLFHSGYSYTSCASLTTCENCTDAYGCHWCGKKESCHARGSPYGCARGDSCGPKPPPPSPSPSPSKRNTTCASHTTCHDCALASHFCHWCEHDNACHAVGSRYGCAVGVDCYSNDRCRRKESEAIPQPSSPVRAVLDRVPTMGLVVILVVGGVCILCLCCCHYFTVRRAHSQYEEMIRSYEDGNFYTPLAGSTDNEEDVTTEEENQPSTDGGTNEDNDDVVDSTGTGTGTGTSSSTSTGSSTSTSTSTSSNVDTSGGEPNSGGADHAAAEQPSQPTEDSDNQNSSDPEHQQQDPDPDPEHNGENENRYYTMDEPVPNTIHQRRLDNRDSETRPLLHPSFNGSMGLTEQPYAIKRSHRWCSMLMYLSIAVVASIVGMSLFFFPQIPVFNVCNDEVAWTKIIKNIVVFKIDADFEILASISNPNRVAAALDQGNGSFSFDGEPFGTYVIPSMVVEPMSITDFTIIVDISPADNSQAIHLAEAFYMGELVLEAEFEGTIRVPDVFNFTKSIKAQNVTVDINAVSDRSLCHCPTWDDDKNHSSDSLIQMMEDHWIPFWRA